MNASTAIILAILLVIGFFAVRSIVKNRKSGGCPGCSSCHADSECASCSDTEQSPAEKK